MTTERSPSSALRWIGAVLAGAGLGGAAAFGLTQLLAPAGQDLVGAWHALPAPTAMVLAAPFAAALIVALLGGGGAAAPASEPKPTAVAPPPPDRGEAALRLLALFQQEGRFVDFLEEELTPYTDAQIGSAVRSIHGGCRAVLKERLDLAPILPGAEGATVTVERGFDPAAVRVTGNVRGEPPYQGMLAPSGLAVGGVPVARDHRRPGSHDPGARRGRGSLSRMARDAISGASGTSSRASGVHVPPARRPAGSSASISAPPTACWPPPTRGATRRRSRCCRSRRWWHRSRSRRATCCRPFSISAAATRSAPSTFPGRAVATSRSACWRGRVAPRCRVAWWRRRNRGSAIAASIARRRSCRGAPRKTRAASRRSPPPPLTSAHLREAWNAAHAGERGARLEAQDIYLTVPASFDAAARELTVKAASEAGLGEVTLLEEPQAACYAWIDANGDAWRHAAPRRATSSGVRRRRRHQRLQPDRRHGGGRARSRSGAIAVGDHILLGGDNMDLTLAYHVRAALGAGGHQRSTSGRCGRWCTRCRGAKETLLAADAPASAPVAVLGRSRQGDRRRAQDRARARRRGADPGRRLLPAARRRRAPATRPPHRLDRDGPALRGRCAADGAPRRVPRRAIARRVRRPRCSSTAA